MSHDLEPIVARAEIARPVIAPDEAKQMVQELRQLIAQILVKDKHYMSVRGRDVLLKAGAEELGKFFGLSSTYEDLEIHAEEIEDVKVWVASMKCSVLNASGRILAESYGFYSGDERRDKRGKITPQPANTIVKMAQKRAFVGAILTATGTSELFTQDIEDAEPVPTVADRIATEPEKLLLAEVYAQKKPATMTEAGAYIAENPKHTSANWVARQIMAMLLKGDPKPGTEDDPALDEPELEADPSVLEGEVTNADESIPF